MTSVLDLLDTQEGMGRLLGEALFPPQQQQQPQPQPPTPMPPQSVMNQAGPSFAPNTPNPGGNVLMANAEPMAATPAALRPPTQPNIGGGQLAPRPQTAEEGPHELAGLPELGGEPNTDGSNVGNQLYPQPVGPVRSPLAQARSSLLDQLQNPAKRDRFFAMTMAEVGNQGAAAQQKFMEATINRALARGESLDQVLSGSYFPPETYAHAARGVTGEQRDALMPILDSVLGGSNAGRMATGNASRDPRTGRWVGFAGGPMTTASGGERYGIEGPDVPWAREMLASQARAGIADTPPLEGEGARGGGGGGFSRGGLASALGLPADFGIGRGQPHAWEATLAGLGKGLSAVGAQRPGASGAASFAAGLGGSLQGGAEAMKARRDDLFNQSSTAFRDMIAAQAADRLQQTADSQQEVAQARIRYLDAQAKLAAAGGKGAAGGAYRDPHYMALQLESQLDRYRNRRSVEKNQSIANGTLKPEDVKKYDAETEETIKKERTERSKRYGFDENEFKRGTKETPFDMENLSPEKREQMPEGAWFRYPAKTDADKKKANEQNKKRGLPENGYFYDQRNYDSRPPTPGWQRQGAIPETQQPLDQPPQQQQQPQSQYAATEDALSGE